MTSTGLEPFFAPNGVAIIGASSSPDKLSYGVVKNMVAHGYPGPIYPINPKGGEILGLTVYTSILEVPDPIELAVIMVAAPLVPGVLEQCGQRGLRAVIVITGGFREAGPDGVALEQQLKAITERYGIRMIGPNCVGVMDTYLPLDTTFITAMPGQGHIAFVSHSGAICGGTTDWARSVGVGYSRIASLGNQVDVDIADGIRMMEDDPHTRVISVYAEGLPDGRRFVEAAQQVYRRKPIVMLKAGLTAAGTRAVASHTGALAGSGQAYLAACHRAGVLVVNSLQEQNDVAIALATQPLPRGNRVAILTNAGGPAALAADGLDRDGLVMADLSAETQARLAAVVPRGAQLGNPVDMLGGPAAEMYALAGRILLEDPDVDMLLAIFVPQAITPADDVAASVLEAAKDSTKPVICCLVGGESIAKAVRLLNEGGVPFYQDPNRAARALGGLSAYSLLQQRADLRPVAVRGTQPERARDALQRGWKAHGAGFVSPQVAAEAVAAYGIRVPFSGSAATADEAVSLAEEVGFPVALKLVAAEVVHKADIGGVALNLQSSEAVRAAYARVVGNTPGRSAFVQRMAPKGQEIIVGARRDEQFGPLLMVGLGGVYVETLRDVAFRLAPLCPADARDMLGETAAGRILAGLRGVAPADVDAVTDTLCRLGQLVNDFPSIAEMDINPLFVDVAGSGVWAVDVRIALDKHP